MYVRSDNVVGQTGLELATRRSRVGSDDQLTPGPPRAPSTSEAAATPVPYILVALQPTASRRPVAAGLIPTGTRRRTQRDETQPAEMEQLADDQPAETA